MHFDYCFTYVGETGKNMEAVFAEARTLGTSLVMDIESIILISIRCNYCV